MTACSRPAMQRAAELGTVCRQQRSGLGAGQGVSQGERGSMQLAHMALLLGLTEAEGLPKCGCFLGRCTLF